MPSLWKSSPSTRRPATAHASIRGRISGPIPIASPIDDEFPMRNSGGSSLATAVKDEEFPIRNPGTNIASMTPLPEESVSDLVQQQQQQQQQEQQDPQEDDQQTLPPQASSVTIGASASRGGDTPVQGDNPEPPSHPPPPPPSGSPPARARTPPQRTSPQRTSPRRTNPSSTLRYSTVSEAPTGTTGRSRDGAPQRKKSTLRSALGKLFGRRKKQGSSSTIGRMSGMITTSQHRSVSRAREFSKLPANCQTWHRETWL